MFTQFVVFGYDGWRRVLVWGSWRAEEGWGSTGAECGETIRLVRVRVIYGERGWRGLGFNVGGDPGRVGVLGFLGH